MSFDIRICTQPQNGATHSSLTAVARKARTGGLDGFFSGPPHAYADASNFYIRGSDHLESLTSLAAIAAVVDDIRVGTLLASAPFDTVDCRPGRCDD